MSKTTSSATAATAAAAAAVDEDNNTYDEEEEVDLEEDFIESMSRVTVAVEAPISNVERIMVYQEQLRAKYGLVRQYEARTAGRLVEPTATQAFPVLCVFLGPSKDTFASDPEAPSDWNPFVRRDGGGYTKSLTGLNNAMQKHKNLGLDNFYLIDAFPLLFWGAGKSGGPTAKQYEAHFKYGVDYVKYVISVVRPRMILSFGSQSAFVVEAAFRVFNPLRSNFGTTGSYQHSFHKEVMVDGMTVYYCKHPSCRSPDKNDLVKAALDEIAAYNV